MHFSFNTLTTGSRSYIKYSKKCFIITSNTSKIGNWLKLKPFPHCLHSVEQTHNKTRSRLGGWIVTYKSLFFVTSSASSWSLCSQLFFVTSSASSWSLCSQECGKGLYYVRQLFFSVRYLIKTLCLLVKFIRITQLLATQRFTVPCIALWHLNESDDFLNC